MKVLLAPCTSRSVGSAAEILEPVMRDLAVMEEEMKAAGVWVFAGGLHGPEASTVVRVRDGEAHHGRPVRRGQGHLGGFVIIKVPDLDAALRWAASRPRPCGSCRSRSARSRARPGAEQRRAGDAARGDRSRVPAGIRAGGRRPGPPLRRHRPCRGGSPGRLPPRPSTAGRGQGRRRARPAGSSLPPATGRSTACAGRPSARTGTPRRRCCTPPTTTCMTRRDPCEMTGFRL